MDAKLNATAVAGKIREFSTSLRTTETTRPLALSEAELGGQLDGLLLRCNYPSCLSRGGQAQQAAGRA